MRNAPQSRVLETRDQRMVGGSLRSGPPSPSVVPGSGREELGDHVLALPARMAGDEVREDPNNEPLPG
jgi:hypothetical protein